VGVLIFRNRSSHDSASFGTALRKGKLVSLLSPGLHCFGRESYKCLSIFPLLSKEDPNDHFSESELIGKDT
jgi:hypothetical protein